MGMKCTFRIVGLFVEKYVGEDIEGHNCDFRYFPEEMNRYHFMVKDEHYGNRYIITLYNTYGECGSGWCTASWGNMDIRTENIQPMPFTHKPNRDLYFTIEIADVSITRFRVSKVFKEYFGGDEDAFTLTSDSGVDIFSMSFTGDDKYYPGGGVGVNMDLFKELPRAKKKRPVYIVIGESGIGKSSLFRDIPAWDKLETDSVNELPEVITQSVIIVGHKHPKFTVKEIKKRLFGDPEVVIVDMYH